MSGEGGLGMGERGEWIGVLRKKGENAQPPSPTIVWTSRKKFKLFLLAGWLWLRTQKTVFTFWGDSISTFPGNVEIESPRTVLILWQNSLGILT